MIRQGFPHEFLHELAGGQAPLVGHRFDVLDQGLGEPHGPLLDLLPFDRGGYLGVTAPPRSLRLGPIWRQAGSSTTSKASAATGAMSSVRMRSREGPTSSGWRGLEERRRVRHLRSGRRHGGQGHGVRGEVSRQR
jgi:hypothetical protein